MHFFSASLLAVLATSSLTSTIAAPLQLLRVRAVGDLASFGIACATVGVAGNLTFQTRDLLNKIKTTDKNVAAQLSAIDGTLTTAFDSGETARPVCEAPDANKLDAQFTTACDAINIASTVTATTIGLINQIQTDDQNLAGQIDVLKASMNAVNTAGSVAGGVCGALAASQGNNNNKNNNNNGNNQNQNQNANAANNNNNNNKNNNGNANANANNANKNANANSTNNAANKNQNNNTNNSNVNAKKTTSSSSSTSRTAAKAAQTQSSSQKQ
ncbi:hypothetical protein R3P38DRAFT_3433496 [Favolaschia claudopus]|uniref:Uncharacterized protein n=1 Tax=Favolaschia claudopus TaxID=2862362 RepID=A0AAW0D0V8_9AGAR